MSFYCFEIDEESKHITSTIHPNGTLLEYNCLPIGLRISPDACQAAMEDKLDGLELIVYIDHIGYFSDGTCEEQMTHVNKILKQLAVNGMKTNPLKCEWAVENTTFLGYDMTPTECKPMKKKVEALLRMQEPQNKKQLRRFIGGINYYKTMWSQRSHVLAPLLELTGDAPFVWGPRQELAFKEMKALLMHDFLNAYPDLNLPFDVYTNASDYQLGAAIIQNGRPIAYYSRMLNDGEKNYTTTEKELLAIVLVLKEYQKMLLGAQITVHMDHKNLMFQTMSMQRVLCW